MLDYCCFQPSRESKNAKVFLVCSVLTQDGSPLRWSWQHSPLFNMFLILPICFTLVLEHWVSLSWSSPRKLFLPSLIKLIAPPLVVRKDVCWVFFASKIHRLFQHFSSSPTDWSHKFHGSDFFGCQLILAQIHKLCYEHSSLQSYSLSCTTGSGSMLIKHDREWLPATTTDG